jgi:hypothetical protein
MRYFLLIFGIVVVGVMLVAGRQGDMSRNRPLQIFPDMKRQAKLRPQTANGFFANGLSSQLPQPGTVAQEKPMLVGTNAVYSFEDVPVNTGRVTGSTNSPRAARAARCIRSTLPASQANSQATTRSSPAMSACRRCGRRATSR